MHLLHFYHGQNFIPMRSILSTFHYRAIRINTMKHPTGIQFPRRLYEKFTHSILITFMQDQYPKKHFGARGALSISSKNIQYSLISGRRAIQRQSICRTTSILIKEPQYIYPMHASIAKSCIDFHLNSTKLNFLHTEHRS